ncbi:MAG: sigma-70 family RNA polymerase sigma factor [Cyanobacteria bacterium P01_C01_bin.38]
MRPREDITEMFSTFVELKNDRFNKWLVDIQLRRSMLRSLKGSPEASKKEDFWVFYWHQQWLSQSNHFAAMHMQAYLQESLYLVSRKKAVRLVNSSYGIADYFQMANAEVEAILESFDPLKSSNFKAYSMMAIKNRLRDILRQRKEADPCSNWALLRKVSKKLFVEALNRIGLSAFTTSQYRLAWTCFKQLYVQTQPAGTASLPEPTPQLWQAIADLYNNSRHQLTMETPECSAKQIEEWLKQSVVYLRTYLFPRISSLNIKTDSDTSQPVDLPDPNSDSFIAEIIAAEEWKERQEQISQMFGVLLNAFQKLDIKSQEIIRLYYQEELTQQQIMQQLQMSQSTVSRKLVKARESLLEALVRWGKELNIFVKPNQIKDMSIALEEWLKNQLGNFDVNP